MTSLSVSAFRVVSRDLRLRCGLLRELSRELRVRSRECRERLTEAATRVESAAVTLGDANGETQMRRLVRAETDLSAAIAECSLALAEVRRELVWRNPSTIVH